MYIAALLALTQGITPTLKSPASVPSYLSPSSELKFTENRGQWDAKAAFCARTKDVDLWVTKTGLAYDWHGPTVETKDGKQSTSCAIGVEFVGASGLGVPEGLRATKGLSNYYLGNVKAAGVRSFSAAKIHDLYPGIDLVSYFDEQEHRPRYDLIVHPGADPSQIRMRYQGAKNLTVKDGALQYDLPFSHVSESRQMAYQAGDGKADYHFMPQSVLQKDGTVGFNVDGYRKDRTLVIDPLIYSTYLGGNGSDTINAMKRDASGNIFVTGATTSTNFPTAFLGNFVNNGGSDAFLTEFNPAGGFVFSTYFGGTGNDAATKLALNSSGKPYIAGTTNSPTLPGTGEGDPTGAIFGFVASFSTNGSLNGSQFLSADPFSNTTPGGLAITPLGLVDVVSYSNNQLLADQFSSDLSAIAHNLFSGTVWTHINGAAVDNTGALFVAGSSVSSNIASGFQPTNGNAALDNPNTDNVFIQKLSSSLLTVTNSTYLGGPGTSDSVDILVDSFQNPVVLGEVQNSNPTLGGSSIPATFPTTPGAYLSGNSYTQNFFVSKLSSDLGSLSASTLFGGAQTVTPLALGLDASNNPLVAIAQFGGFPTTWDYFSGRATGGGIVKLSSDLTTELYGSYFGNSNGTQINAIAADSSNNIYLAGRTNDAAFATQNPHQATLAGAQNGFLSVINPVVTPGLSRIASDRGTTPALAGGVGKTVTISVYFAEPIGTQVSLTSSDPAVHVNGGPSSTYTVVGSEHVEAFTITADDVATATTSTLTASDGTNTLTIPVIAQPFIRLLVTKPVTVVSGGSLTAYVYPYEAPATPQTVSITTSPSVTSPITSTITFGTALQVNVPFGSVDNTTPVTLTASHVGGASSASVAFTLQPVSVSALTLDTNSMGVAGFNSAHLTLNAPAPQDETYTIVSNNPIITPNVSIFIAQGSNFGSQSFNGVDYFGSTASQSATYSVTIGGVKKTAVVTVQSDQVTGFFDSESPLIDGDSETFQVNTAWLTSSAPTFQVTSSAPNIIPSFTIQPGSNVSFTPAYQGLTANKVIQFTMRWVGPGGALYGPTSVLSVTMVPKIKSITMTPTTVQGGSTTPIVGDIETNAFFFDQPITVTSSSPLAYFDGTPGNQSTTVTGFYSGQFTVNTQPVTKTTKVTITVVNPLGTPSKTFTLTITP